MSASPKSSSEVKLYNKKSSLKLPIPSRVLNNNDDILAVNPDA